MQLLIATSCSARKTATAISSLRARSLPLGTPAALAHEWRSRCERVGGKISARRLYLGRNFSIALAVAESCGAQLRVISAGMGLLNPNAPISPYSLTVSSGAPDCILSRAPRGQAFSAQQWWCAIRARNSNSSPFARLLSTYPRALLTIGVSRPYLEMIAGELDALGDSARDRLRIVGLTEPKILPERLWPYVMPYDARLNDEASSLRGTAFDFPSRALAHFIGLIRIDRRIDTPASHARRVRQSLAHRKAPVRRSRLRIDDETLSRKIKMLKTQGCSRAGALQHLRAELGLACEQERFATAWSLM